MRTGKFEKCSYIVIDWDEIYDCMMYNQMINC